MATNPALLELGIEEDTGLLIENERRATVLGTGTVIVVDGPSIEINHVGYAENRDPFALTNVVYSVLTPRVVFGLQSRKVIDPGPTGPAKSIVPEDVRRPEVVNPDG